MTLYKYPLKSSEDDSEILKNTESRQHFWNGGGGKMLPPHLRIRVQKILSDDLEDPGSYFTSWSR